MYGMKYKLTFTQNISRWDEGIPLGNGQMGCLIWGDEKELYFSLDRVEIWDRTTPFGTEEADFTYETLIKLAKEKNTEKIRDIFDAPYNYAVPTKLPVGRIVLGFNEQIETTSELSLRDAKASFAVKSGKEEYAICTFVSAVQNIGLLQITKENVNHHLKIRLENPKFGKKEKGDRKAPGCIREISKGDLTELKYEPAVIREITNSDGVRLQYFTQKADGQFSYGIVMGVRETENEILLCYQVATSNDGEDWLYDALGWVEDYLYRKPVKLLKNHRKWWKQFWGKSALMLPDKQFEKQWYLANYLLASCSGKGGYPMPLQGVWTAADGKLPPWKGDYHNDLNTQMSYYHYLKANHLEEGRCFLDFLWNRMDAGRKFAAEFYGTSGQCLPAVMTIDGQPLGGWAMYSLSPANQIWLCHAFAQYYLYTGDLEFLKERAYPYLEETAWCIRELLEEGDDGKLYLPISSSPEIHDDKAESFVTPNSNYDLALMHFLFETLAEYAVQLDNGKAGMWSTVRKQLPNLAVSEQGIMMISPDEMLKESHRHLSNAMAIHPLRQIVYYGVANRRKIDATIADFERLGTKNWVGFSFCWMAELYAVQKNGDKAYEMLSVFWNYFCSPNGFHLNGDYKKGGYSSFTYRPFTLEANMCAADALQEMLFYMEDGRIELFPAIPKEWEKKKTAFTNLRGEKGILVSAELVRGRLKSLSILSETEETFILQGWTREGIRSRNASFTVKSGDMLFLQ